MEQKFVSIAFFAALACTGFSSSAQAATFDIEWSGLSDGEFSTTATDISRTLNGVTVTARGFSVSVPPAGGAETLSGPLPAVDIANCNNLNPAICPGGRAEGLRISRAGLGIRGTTGLASGGITNLGLNGYTDAATGNLVTEFISFSFSAAVDIGSIVVDDVSNAPRPIWFAASDAAVNLASGFGSVLSSLGVTNSPDDTTDGLFSHAANLSGVKTLIVGAPFASGDFFGITPSNANFYVRGLSDVAMTDAVDPDPSPIPVSASMPLMVTALLGVGLLARRRKSG